MNAINTISTKTYLNTFSQETFYHIEVDGKVLEDIVLECRPEILRGLVPTLLNWLDNPDEQKVVWSRALPTANQKANLPILMCSEDIDLWCTLIMVEVEVDKNHIYWNKFGLENSDAQRPEEIGKSIDWFSNSPRFIFDKSDYEEFLNEFRLRINQADIYTPKNGEIVQDYKI